jgi:ABC-type branched-subunit amino acid transport system substrate-binding protein
MRNRRLVRAAAVFSGLALILAACGDDDEGETSTESTEAASGAEETTTTAAEDGGGGGGELAGMRGTTPLPETTPEVEAFQARMLEVDPALEDFNYGPESYDAAIVIALAVVVAGDDGSAHASEIIEVTKNGEVCTTFADCLALAEAGTDFDFNGISGPVDLDGVGDPIVGSYGVLQFGDDNQIDDTLTEFIVAEATEEIASQPVVPVEATRAGDGVLTIGTLLPETGSLAFLGPPEIAGVKVAIAEINAAGGVLGTDVVLVEGDSGDTSTDTATQTVTRELSQNVDAIIGAASSGVSLSVIDQVVGAGVTMFSPANTSKELSTYPDRGLYFRAAPSDILQGQVLAQVVADDGNSSVVILNLDDSYGNGLAEDFTASFEASGGEVLDTIVYDPQAQTFDAEVGQAAGADADAIILIGFEESSRILATMVEQGVGPNDIPVYGVDGNMGNALGTDFDAGE